MGGDRKRLGKGKKLNHHAPVVDQRREAAQKEKVEGSSEKVEEIEKSRGVGKISKIAQT